ncbi:MAG: hypothetical protein ACE5G3_01725 [Gammaproteobacteria bacterium]
MSTPMTAGLPIARNRIAAAWGAAGVVGICSFAIWRLTPYTVEAVAAGLSALQWVALLINVAFMAWSEGYRGFQQSFAPRVAARVLYLYRMPMPWWMRVLAPLFCIGYFRASRRARIGAWAGTLGIVVLVLLVYQLPQPWRGIVDAGVVVGLSWGVASLVLACARAAVGGECQASHEVPE